MLPKKNRMEVARILERAQQAFDAVICEELGHVTFAYESGAYCGRCGVELSRRDVCKCGHPEVDHGNVKTSGEWSAPMTYANACKRFGCNDCLEYVARHG